VSLVERYAVIRDVINDCAGYRVLEDEDVLRLGDETKCGSIMLSLRFDEEWHVLDEEEWAEYIGKTVAWANDARRHGCVRAAVPKEVMKLPKHVGAIVRHNQHRLYYETVEQYLARDEGQEMDPADRATMIATGEVWEIVWYPDTPVGSCCVLAATLERALELANE
jgi:hypothetical protein